MTREIWEEILKHGAYVQELDWYALDKNGNIGIFTAIMNAPIPGKIKASYDNYIGLKYFIDSLPKSSSFLLTTAESGNFSDWTHNAEKGLFAYDFHDVHRTTVKNKYDLIARPTLPLNIKDINIPINLLDTLIQLDCDFLDGDVKIELLV